MIHLHRKERALWRRQHLQNINSEQESLDVGIMPKRQFRAKKLSPGMTEAGHGRAGQRSFSSCSGEHRLIVYRQRHREAKTRAEN